MAYFLNKITIIGNVAQPPKITQQDDGTRRMTFMVATNEIWFDKATNKKKEKTEWHKVVVFNENMIEYGKDIIDKGVKVYVEGQLQSREWQDKDGAKRTTVEIIVPRFKGELIIFKNNAGEDNDLPAQTLKNSNNNNKKENLIHDDLPF